MAPSDAGGDTRTRLAIAGQVRAEAVEWSDEATSRLRKAVRDADAAGMSQSEAARVAGVSRMTVRAWLGK
jgi:DNA-directed RNA polymerase specialized sigma24 family protein